MDNLLKLVLLLASIVAISIAERFDSGIDLRSANDAFQAKVFPLPPPPRHPPPPGGIPAGFEKVIPEEWLVQLRDLHNDTTLSFPEKRQKFEEIMATVPTDVLLKLPLAPIFEPLPEEWKNKIRAVYANSSIQWIDKHQKIGDLVESMPAEIRQLLPPPPPFLPQNPPNNGFPLTPPPGFDKILPNDTYEELLKIHQDPAITPKEKAERIDKIMRSLDQAIIDKLPLPPGFEKLPEDKMNEARAIFTDKTLSYQEKDRKVGEFVLGLAPHLRKLLRPDLPPPLNQLPQNVQDQIQEIFDDPAADTQTRHQKFWKLVRSLPEDQSKLVKASFSSPPQLFAPPPKQRSRL